MKKIVVAILVILALNINAQTVGDVQYNGTNLETWNGSSWTTILVPTTVNPESFTALAKQDFYGKYVYTNTGGEGKIMMDSVFSIVHNWVINGLSTNGLDSMKLGGDLIENTTINTNGNSFIINHAVDNSLQTGYYINGCQKGITDYTHNGDFNHLVQVQTLKDTCTDYMASLIGYINNFTQYGKYLEAVYNPTIDENHLSVAIRNTTSGLPQDNAFVEFGGGNTFNPTPTAMTITASVDYTGDLLEVIFSGSTYLKILNNGYIILEVPIYNNNADAIANGLPAGAVYRTPTGNLRIRF